MTTAPGTATPSTPAVNPALNLNEDKLMADLFQGTPALDAGRQRVMVDVGAFFGGTARPFLNMGWRVIAIEPDPSKHDKLRAVGTPPQFTMLPCAVADPASRGQTLAFYTSPESPGIASLLPFRDSHSVATHVDVRTLADVLAEHAVERVDYLKIDAEGYDLRVLEGFPWAKTREAQRPLAVMAEFEDAKTTRLGVTQRDIARFLADLGYRVFMSEWHPIVRYGITHRWRRLAPWPCEPLDERAWGNFIAVQPGTLEQRLLTLAAEHEARIRNE